MTIKEIAERAGVSVASVSNVINGNYRKVSAQTRERIEKIIAESDYKPNAAARSLATQQSRIVSLVIANIGEYFSFNSNPYYAELIADMIVQATGCDRYAIQVVDRYASSYSETVKQAGVENRSDDFRMLAGNAPDLSAYDTVFLVHPLWWGTLPEPVVTFLMGMDLTGKTVYNVVTHGGSGLGQAVVATRAYTQATVSDNALAVFDDDAASARPQVTAWLKGL